jgi:precorrin-6A/cobalt-precorrin-6A reductase
MRRLLLLAGTEEAALFARATASEFGGGLELVAALAGGGERPVPRADLVRIGGFGGAAGMARYLREERVDLLVDASDPFAARLSAEAREACACAEVPRLQLYPRPWRPTPLDRWIVVEEVAAAARAVRHVGRRAFLSVGSAALDGFAGLHEVNFLVRLAAPPRRRLPLRFYELAIGPGPFSPAAERHLLELHAIDVVVARATGGAAAAAPLVAAREASLPVVMLRRPAAEPGEVAESVEDALSWLAARLAPQRSARNPSR